MIALLGSLGVLVGTWLVSVNSYDDGVFTCILTVHPLNEAILKRTRISLESAEEIRH